MEIIYGIQVCSIQIEYTFVRIMQHVSKKIYSILRKVHIMREDKILTNILFKSHNITKTKFQLAKQLQSESSTANRVMTLPSLRWHTIYINDERSNFKF